jgi:hypothetical protein
MRRTDLPSDALALSAAIVARHLRQDELTRIGRNPEIIC